MRNELNNITSKLFKTDLSQHKIELESVNIGDYTSKANQIEKEFNDEYKKQILAVQSTVVKYNNMIADVANNFDKEIELYKSKVKDLGIDYNSVPLSKVADAARKSIMNKPTYFKSIMDKLKSL
jgi:ABC-type phosphate transport system auxiliary subunit